MSILLEPYPSGTVGYLAFPEQKQFLISELRERFFLTEKDILKSHVAENLFLFTPDMLPSELTGPKPEKVPYWSSTVLLNPQKANFNSIGEAAGLLKDFRTGRQPVLWLVHISGRPLLIFQTAFREDIPQGSRRHQVDRRKLSFFIHQRIRCRHDGDEEELRPVFISPGVRFPLLGRPSLVFRESILVLLGQRASGACNPAVGTDKERGQAVGQESVRPGQVFLHKAGLRGQDTGEILEAGSFALHQSLYQH